MVMGMREKLIELVKQGYNKYFNPNWALDFFALIADHLIANGVTIDKDNNVPSKWIPVTERLPEEDGYYLVFQKGFLIAGIRTLQFTKDGRKVDKYDFHRGWKNVWYRYDSEWGHLTIDDVTHWMPLPEPPKGE